MKISTKKIFIESFKAASARLSIKLRDRVKEIGVEKATEEFIDNLSCFLDRELDEA